jgi:glycosyltransferase involved in cell wall biosynthesis
MPDSPESSRQPAVSIILPTYNRERFLPQAFASIREQRFTDWELIVVDDGSTDDTRELIAALSAGIPQPVRYIYQENQGAYGARNTGLDYAEGKYVAFFDSDDLWLPHHLRDCVQALNANEDVDWVYGACRMVDDATGRVIADNTFYVDGKPRPFLNLNSRIAGHLRVIEDVDAMQCMLLHGFYNGLQNSVIRGTCFESERFEWESRNEAEDRLVVLRALAGGRRLGFFENVHVIYRVHQSNSSGVALAASIERRRKVLETLIEGYERLPGQIPLGRKELIALRRRIHLEAFWHLGCGVLWNSGLRADALAAFRRGLRYWPWDWRCWKTYLLAVLKSLVYRQVGKR